MARVLKKTRIKGLPPKVQLRERDAVSGSIPSPARLASDNRTGNFRTYFDDLKTVSFQSYQSSSLPRGFNVIAEDGTYPNYTLGPSTQNDGNVLVWWRFEDKKYEDDRWISLNEAGNHHSASFVQNDYEISDENPSYYNGDSFDFPNRKSVHITGNVIGDDTLCTEILTGSIADSDELTTGTPPLPKFTIAMHVNIDALEDPKNPLVWRGIRTSFVADWELLVTFDGAIEFGIFKTSTGSHRIYKTATGIVSINTWHHIAVTLEATGTRSNVTVKIYLDGVLKSTSITVDTGWATNEGPNLAGFTVTQNQLYLGAAYDNDYIGGDAVISAYFDQVVIANRAASATEINYLYLGGPTGQDRVSVGVSLPAGLHSSNNALYRVTRYGQLAQNPELNTGFAVTGVIRKGVGDKHVTFTPGQDFQPFRDDWHPAVEGKSYISGSTTQNPFYATGSAISDVGEGFNQPLWSKTKIEIDLTPSMVHSFSFQNGTSGSSGVNYPVAYWNHETKKYEGIGEGKVFHNYVGGTNDAERLIRLKQMLEEQPIIFGESMWEVLGSPNPQLNESRGHVISNFGFPYHPKFHATSSNSIAVSDLIDRPFLVEKIVLEFSGAFGVGASYSNNQYNYNAAVAGFFLLNQRFPFSVNDPGAQTIDYAVPTFGQFVTGAFVPGVGTYPYSTGRDLITTLRIASFIESSGLEETAGQVNANLSLFLPNRSGFGTFGPPTWSGRYQVSGTVNSPIANAGMQSILTSGSGSACFLLTKLAKSNRSGLFGSTGRSFVCDLSSGEVARRETQNWTFDVLKKYSRVNPYFLFPGDRLIIGWQAPWSRIMNETTLNVTEFSGQGSYLEFSPTPAKLVIYGSEIREGKEHHDTLNQLLSSVTVHEVIG